MPADTPVTHTPSTTPVRYALRTATMADLGWLIELRKQTMTPSFETLGERLSHAQHEARVLDHFDDIRIITAHDQDVGMLKLIREREHWRLVQIQLLARFQGRGIGGAIVSNLLADARSQRMPVVLSVLKNNPAKRLYSRLGFEVTAAKKRSYAMRFEP